MPTPDVAVRAARLDRWVVTAAVVASSVVIWTPAQDAVGIPKLTVALFAGAGALVVGLWRTLGSATILRPLRTPAHVVVGVFVLAGLVSVAVSESTSRSLLGQRGRASGYLLYAAAALVFVAAARSFDQRTVRRFGAALTWCGAAVAAIALLQWVGVDWFRWGAGDGVVLSTMGNPNFASGLLGAIAPITLVAALESPAGRARLAMFACIGAIALAAFQTGSAQGWIGGAAGGALVVGYWIITRAAPERRRLLLWLTVAALVVGIVVVLAGLSGAGPLSRLDDVGFAFRRHYWSAAVEMLGSKPVFGVGFDMWGGYYREFRSAAAAAGGLGNVTDEPHSVFLAMFANGGLVLGLSYLAILAATAWGLVTAFRAGDERDRFLLVGLAGALVAFHLQSAVSIELPTFALLHFALVGMVAAIAWPARAVIEVPWLVRPTQQRRGKRGRRAVPRFAGAPAALAATVLAVLALWQLSRPFRAELAAKRSRELVGASQGAALGKLRDATRLIKWEPEYWSMLGDDFFNHGNFDLAAQTYERALDLDPRRFADVLNAARSAVGAKDNELAFSYYDRALELEPNAVDLKFEYARQLTDANEYERAEGLISVALESRPDDPRWLQTRGVVRLGLGDTEDAIADFEDAIAGGLQTDDQLAIVEALVAADELDAAEEFLEMVDLEPHIPEFMIAQAGLLEAEGDVVGALDLYRRVTQGYPGLYPEAEQAVVRLAD